MENQEKVGPGTGDSTQDFGTEGNPEGNPEAPDGNDPTDGDKEPTDETGDDDDDNVPGDDDDDTAGDDDDDDDDTTVDDKFESVSQSFDTSLVQAASVTSQLDDPFLTQELTLVREYNDVARQYRQGTRPNFTDNFDQGHGGSATSEEFNQLANRPLDILIVIDNSGSMEQEQVNMAGKLQPLLSFVEDTDWRIGVVTTDPNKTCLRALIEKGDADIANKFENALQAGTNGSNNERGVLTAVRSLAGTCLNQPWIRNDSTLAVLMVTDEDNCSDGTECSGKNYASGSYLIDYLNSIRVAGVNAKVYGIFWHPSQSDAECATGYNKANIYSSIVDATNGTWGSICDADYTPTLEAISRNIQSVLGTKFTLSKAPDAGTVKVFVDGVETNDYTVNGRVIQFNNVPPADGSRVRVDYAYGAQPIVNSWSLRYEPVVGRTSVSVDGIALNDTEFSVNAGTRVVTLNSTPAEKAKIVVNYTRNDDLNKKFSFIDSVKQNSMRAFVNGVEVFNFTVSNFLGIITVQFDEAPEENALIDLLYTQVGQAVTRYPFNADDGAPVDLVGYEKVGGGTVRVSYNAGGFVDINSDDWEEGLEIILRYDNLDRQMFEVPLPQMPIAQSLEARGGNKVCKNSLVLDSQTVKVAGCNFPDDATSVEVKYDFLVASYTEFTFDAAVVPPETTYQAWEVFVDGTPTKDYTRVGGVITFPQELPIYSKVEVRMTVKK